MVAADRQSRRVETAHVHHALDRRRAGRGGRATRLDHPNLEATADGRRGALAWVVAYHALLVACSAPVDGNVGVPGGGTALPGDEALERRLEKLDASGIQARLIGRSLSPDPDAGQNYIGFAEEFHADGRWVTERTERAVVTRTGTWRIVADRICITFPGRGEICREAWLDPATGRIVMRDVGSSVEQRLFLHSRPLH